MVRRTTEPRWSKRFRRFAVYAIASILLLLLSQRPLLPQPSLEVSLNLTKETLEPKAAESERAFFNEAGRSFLIRPDQQGVVALEEESGNPKWEREFGSIITAAAVSDNLSAWGLMDGRIFILDQDGVMLRIIDPRNDGVKSTQPCVYALALSAQGESVAILYGIFPQNFLLYERKAGFYSLSYTKELQKDLRSTQSAAFSNQGAEVLVKTAEGLLYFDRNTGKGAVLHQERFAGEQEMLIKALGETGFAFLTATADKRHAGVIQHGALAAYFPLPIDSYGLAVSGDSFSIFGQEKDLAFTWGVYE